MRRVNALSSGRIMAG